ncbi:MAG: polysaccharide deacetylase family protein [Candidatus Hodarchaeota archaeon]
MINIAISCNEKDNYKVKYTFDILFQILGMKFNNVNSCEFDKTDLTICYGKKLDTTKLIFIPHYKNIEGDKDKKGNDVPEISGFFKWQDKRIPFWYKYINLKKMSIDASEDITAEDSSKVIIKKNNSIYFGFDIVMSAFHLLSCQEEYLINKRDKHGRFLGEYSPRNKYNLLEEPIVHYYAFLLREYILSVSDYTYGLALKNGLKVLLTHDVDNIDKNFWLLTRKIFLFLKSPSLIKFKSLLNFLLTNKCHNWNFDKYMKLENKYNAKSVFYFLGGKKSRYGARYNWDKLKKIFSVIQKRGWGIGLHANYYYYDNALKLKNNKEMLELVSNSRVIGNRTHYLRFKIPRTFYKLIEADVKYDTSVSYPDVVGFRAGIAFPYKPFDIERNQVIDIIEVPLVIMDVVLFTQLGSDKEKILNKIKELIDKIAEINGYVAINWHNLYLNKEEFNGCGEIYEAILNYIYVLGGKFITEKELLEIKNRNFIKIN